MLQLRNVCMELRNVCCHPALSDWAERSGTTAAAGAEQPGDATAAVGSAAAGGAPGAATPAPPAQDDDAPGSEHGARLTADRLVKGSAKLALLDSMLHELHAEGKRVMVLAQSSKALDAAEALERERYCVGAAPAVPAVAGAAAASTAAVAAAFIEPCYERVDTTTKTAERQQAVARFNASCTGGASGSRWLFLQHTRSCGVGTDLPGIDVAIFLDSDWSARKDAQVQAADCAQGCEACAGGFGGMSQSSSTFAPLLPCASPPGNQLLHAHGCVAATASLQLPSKPAPPPLPFCRRCRTRCAWALRPRCVCTACTAEAPARSACCSCLTACAAWTRSASRAMAGRWDPAPRRGVLCRSKFARAAPTRLGSCCLF